MGRYYNTQTGRSGKFGFGCQSSTDPKDYFDMAETHITYTVGEESVEQIKQKLNEIYDKAGVPDNERSYRLAHTAKYAEYEWFDNKYHDYFFEACEKGEGNFAGENGTTEREKFANAHLAQSRLWLGLTILTDINEDGYCELDAEL